MTDQQNQTLMENESAQVIFELHKIAVAKAQESVTTLIEDRDKEIGKAKEYSHRPPLVRRAIKSANVNFNKSLRLQSVSANTHFKDCLRAGIEVTEVDLSAFIVAEDEGIE